MAGADARSMRRSLHVALKARGLGVAVGLLLVLLSACGRKATTEDCDLIVDRYVEIELKALKVTDAKIIEQRKVEMRRDLSDDLKACPGRRITDAMLACVRTAETNAEIDKCTRW